MAIISNIPPREPSRVGTKLAKHPTHRQRPRDLVTTIRRIVYLSVETAKIVDGLPDPFGEMGA